MKYYIYIYYDPRKTPPEPFYVGRGNGLRDLSHLSEAKKYKEGVPLLDARKKRLNVLKINLINAIIKLGLDPIILRQEQGLTLEESKALEKEYIRKIGRRIFGEGPLTNMTEGGEGRVVCHAGPLNPFFGKHCSESTRKKLSIIHSGKKLTQNQRDKISKALLGKPKRHHAKEAMRTSMRRRYMDDPTQKMFTVLGESREKIWHLSGPNNQQISISSLRKWCLEMGFSNKTLISALKKNQYVKYGPAAGWKINSCE